MKVFGKSQDLTFSFVWVSFRQQHTNTAHFEKGETEAQALARRAQGHTRREGKT